MPILHTPIGFRAGGPQGPAANAVGQLISVVNVPPIVSVVGGQTIVAVVAPSQIATIVEQV